MKPFLNFDSIGKSTYEAMLCKNENKKENEIKKIYKEKKINAKSSIKSQNKKFKIK